MALHPELLTIILRQADMRYEYDRYDGSRTKLGNAGSLFPDKNEIRSCAAYKKSRSGDNTS